MKIKKRAHSLKVVNRMLSIDPAVRHKINISHREKGIPLSKKKSMFTSANW